MIFSRNKVSALGKYACPDSYRMPSHPAHILPRPTASCRIISLFTTPQHHDHRQDTDKYEAITVLVHGNAKQTHCVALVEAQKTHNDVLTLILPNEKVILTKIL